MRLMGSWKICHTPGQACSAPSILALLPTPGVVSHAIEAAKGVWVMYADQSSGSPLVTPMGVPLGGI